MTHDPVQQQLEAYNAHDGEAFLACYQDPCLVTGRDGATSEQTREELRDSYAALFARHPQLHCEVPTRIRAGQWVVDEEIITGLGADVVHAIAVYRVRDGLIAEFRGLQ